MNPSQLEDYILRQTQGRLTPEEAEAFRAWYDASEDNRKLYIRYAAILKAQAIEHGRDAFRSEQPTAWKRVSREWRQKTAQSRTGHLRHTWWRYAAAACIAFLIGWGWPDAPSTSAVAMQTIETPLGAKSHVTLPDGTRVWLNSGSCLSYHSNFGQSNRQLSLDGEGYFDVARDLQHPFVLRTPTGTLVRVLGTKFNLKAYSEDRESKVTLVEGSLAVYTDTLQLDPSTVMTPNEQVVIDQRTHTWKSHRVDATNYTAWMQLKPEDVTSGSVARKAKSTPLLPNMQVPTSTMRNILFFDEEPLSQIVRDLERAFNIKIQINPEIPTLGEEKYYGDFRNGEDIYTIMDIITSSGNLTYRIEKNTIIISKEH